MERQQKETHNKPSSELKHTINCSHKIFQRRYKCFIIEFTEIGCLSRNRYQAGSLISLRNHLILDKQHICNTLVDMRN